MKKCLLALVVMATLLSSCSINKNIMFRADSEYEFANEAMLQDSTTRDSSDRYYKIAPNDILTLQLFTNDGAIILDFTTSAIDRMPLYGGFDVRYLVDLEGNAEFPTIGKQHIAGYTIYEAQNFLEEKYRTHFNKPYCIVRVTNRRVIVFNGDGSVGTVIPLENQNLSVVEAIALSGGIRERGNASKVKLIRTVNGKQNVYQLDLSTIEGIKYAQTQVQANDIIYVTPVPQLANEFAKDLAPILSLLTSGVLLFYVISQ